MIGWLRGKILRKQAPYLLLDVNGVGYELEAPMSTFFDLPAQGETVALFTHLAVREDAQVLYGFLRDSERIMFRALLKVSGVGAKMALGVLSGMGAEEFTRAIQAGDVIQLTRLPGVGKKTAERLIVEMRDRVEKLGITASATPVPAAAASSVAADNPAADAVSALEALGYRGPEAQRMVRSLDINGLSSEEIIRAALQTAVPSK